MVSMFISIPFGVLTLWMVGKTLNIYSIMGLFLLMGVVKKNAILQVDYTNVLRGDRSEAQEADSTAAHSDDHAAISRGCCRGARRGDGSGHGRRWPPWWAGRFSACWSTIVTPVIYFDVDDSADCVYFPVASHAGSAAAPGCQAANGSRALDRGAGCDTSTFASPEPLTQLSQA
jgi:hypothetical protein